MIAVDGGTTTASGVLTLTYNPKAADVTGTVTFTEWPDEYPRDSTITFNSPDIDNSPAVVELIEAPVRPRAPPPKVQFVLRPTRRNLTSLRPRLTRPRRREGGIGTRNWQCR